MSDLHSPFETIELSQWPRRQHFEFFSQFEEPYFGITSQVECTPLWNFCKRDKNTSFYLRYLHAVMCAVNTTQATRLRIRNQQPVLFKTIHVSATIMRANDTFGFGFFPFYQDYSQFEAAALHETQLVQQETTLFSPRLGPEPRLDVIHFSAVPWVNFSSISHARAFSRHDSVPKISVGKVTTAGVAESSSASFPVAVHLHHALADGRDVSDLLERIKNELARGLC